MSKLSRGLGRVSVALLGALAAVAPSPARADNVLVFQQQNGDPFMGDTAGPEAADILEDLGHTVTRQISTAPTLPADLSGFDSIWVIQLPPPDGVTQTTLVEYAKSGGGLYLTGERPCCPTLNGAVQNMVNRLVPDITNITDQGEGGDEFVAAEDGFGITTTPNAVPEFFGGEAGLMSNIPPRNQVYKQRNGPGFVSAAWAGEYLEEGGGCLFVNMDLSFWFDTIHPEQDKPAWTENVQEFLGHCRDTDQDGATDAGETAAGTNPNDPDSDNDGLCDGYATVAGTCVTGESVFVDTDEDGVINPRDEDDDNDTIPTSYEVGAEQAQPNPDDDSDPAWLDIDSDGNNIPDRVEGQNDFDNDGIPAIVDLGDDPENCDEDADCAVQVGSTGCDPETGFCVGPGNPTGGTGGTGGSGTGGSGTGGSGTGGSGTGGTGTGGSGASSSGGTATGGNGGNAGAGGSGGNGVGPGAESSDSGGCGCSIPGEATGAASSMSLLALALLALRRRRLGSARSR
jgi:MYXO-CTERM domain-containing protein